MADKAATISKPVVTVTAGIQNSHDLAYMFRLFATSLYGVPDYELESMRSMPVPSTATMTVAGSAFPPIWYKTMLPGAADGTTWALYDAASVLEQEWQFVPYPEATIEGAWGAVYPKGAPPIIGWQLIVTMVMDPGTTLLRTINLHRRLLTGVALAGRGNFRFKDAPGPLHMQHLNEHMAD